MPSPLQTAALSTFEALAMLCAEPLDPAAPDAGRPALAHAVRVRFAGPSRGALVLAVSDDVATALAANMLGLDESAVRADARLRQDALGEAANVVCGNVLPLVAGRAAVFHLDAPEAIALADAFPVSPDAAHAGHAGHAEALLVERGRAELVLLFDPPTPADGAAPLPAPVPLP